MSETDGGGGLAAGTSGRPFTICGVAFLIVAAAIALFHASNPITRGWWLVAYVSLVGGVSQILLGRGLFALVERRGAEAPDPRRLRMQLVLWNVGTVTVPVADLAPSAEGVLVGGVLLAAALVLFAIAMRRSARTAQRAASGWARAYSILLVFLAASIVVGTFLAFARGR